jgi:hypothetical protein
MPERTIWYMFHLVQKEKRIAQLHVEAEGVAQAAPEVVWKLVANAALPSVGTVEPSGYDLGAQAPDGAG